MKRKVRAFVASVLVMALAATVGIDRAFAYDSGTEDTFCNYGQSAEVEVYGIHGGSATITWTISNGSQAGYDQRSLPITSYQWNYQQENVGPGLYVVSARIQYNDNNDGSTTALAGCVA